MFLDLKLSMFICLGPMFPVIFHGQVYLFSHDVHLLWKVHYS